MEESNSRKPKIGEIVVFVLDSGSDFGQTRPAQIVKVFESQTEAGNKGGFQAPVLVNLKVYTDNVEEVGEEYPEEGELKFSRCLNLEKLPGTWHYSKIVTPFPAPVQQTKKSRIYTTSLGVMDEAYPDRVTLWNRMVWYL